MRLFILLLLSFALCGNASAADFQALINEGMAAYKSGDFPAAGKLLEEAGNELQRQKNPQAAAVWGNAAIALLRAENFEAAANLYEKILSQKNPPKEKLQQYYSNLVHARSMLKQPALQIQAIERQLKALPKMPPDILAETYARLGDGYRNMEMYQPAVGAYQKAIKSLPKETRPEQRAKLFTALGLAQGMIGQFEAAEKSLLAARELASQLNEQLTIAEADSNIGALRLEQGDYPEAIKYFNAALDREKNAALRLNEGSDLNNMGIALRGAGKFNEAMESINKAISIASEVKNLKGEGFATMNRARGFLLSGQLKEARKDYSRAISLFKEANLKEGTGAALLGLGRLEEKDGKNYDKALRDYDEALKLFQEIKSPRWEAAALLCLGDLYKTMAAPGRTTRDLVFEEEPQMPDRSPAENLADAKASYEKALELAQRIGSREMIWEALRGLGFIDYKEGRLESALKRYQEAIDGVSKMYVSLNDAQIMGDFLAGREDLYTGALEVCSALYDKTKDKKYLDLKLKYSETLKNEVQKASAAVADLTFEDPAKQALYMEMKKIGAAQAKAAKNMPVLIEPPKNASQEEKTQFELAKKAVAEHKAEQKKLDEQYNKKLGEWRKNYPGDKLLFDTNLDDRINIADIQKLLKPDQAALLYVSLPEKLLITVISKDKVDNVSENISEKELKKLILDDLVVGYLSTEGNVDANKANKILARLYDYLIKPIESEIKDKERLYIISDGYLSQIPFTTLVYGEENSQPKYLVEKYEIANMRPSFIRMALEKGARPANLKLMLAVANPKNNNFPMIPLPGTINEVSTANSIMEKRGAIDVAVEAKTWNLEELPKNEFTKTSVHEYFPDMPSIDNTEPTEKWLRDQLTSNKYDIIYFATHGQNQADTVAKLGPVKERKLKDVAQRAMFNMRNLQIPEQTPLNGFLYLSNMPEDKILDDNLQPVTKPLDKKTDGLFTIGEILELGDKTWNGTEFVLLSACNTGVTYSPKAMFKAKIKSQKKDIKDEDFKSDFLNPEETNKALSDAGMRPDVDQATFVESFMRRGVRNVYASYWPVADAAGGIIMKSFWQNLKADDGKNADVVTAYTNAQRAYLADAREYMINQKIEDKDKNEAFSKLLKEGDPREPFNWAAGAMFGI